MKKDSVDMKKDKVEKSTKTLPENQRDNYRSVFSAELSYIEGGIYYSAWINLNDKSIDLIGDPLPDNDEVKLSN